MMSEINVTPLVDVMLVLLVVFIVTAPLLTPQSLTVSVPKTTAVEAASDQEKLLPAHLIVDANGNIQLDNITMSDAQLADVLKQRAIDPLFFMKVEADKTVPYGRVAEFMAIAQSAGVANLSFVTITQ
ncbi:ExbD/TolR family protein [Candidatus Nitrotoga sp. M5]|uniref:ExbD/TolR family protein n=1 Tax=Candidatus Nitrotoga sp. M5 TaxID=2890409 RepID=UPI001EF4BA40|nr:biopolymer transporter ExbD [Candidatus Nitrotoga sp. M5]